MNFLCGNYMEGRPKPGDSETLHENSVGHLKKIMKFVIL